MTGFGRSENSAGGWRCRVEMRSVNNRFLEIRLRGPAGLGPIEETLKEIIKSRCGRGQIDCTINLHPENDQSLVLQLNVPLARSYGRLVEEFHRESGLSVDVSLRDLVDIKDLILGQGWEIGTEGLETLLRDSVTAALAGLMDMRAAEGQATKADLLELIEHLRRLHEEIIPLAKDLPQRFAKRLQENLARMTEGSPPAEDRIIQEIAIFADRCDISEEISRFTAHLSAGEKMLEQGGLVGRKIEFLLQELNREANTMASKCAHAAISARAIEIKGLLEKMREQVQNIE